MRSCAYNGNTTSRYKIQAWLHIVIKIQQASVKKREQLKLE